MPKPPLITQAGKPLAFTILLNDKEIKIIFDEEKQTLSISTQGNNAVIFNEEGKLTTIADQNGNSITLSANGVDIQSIKDVNIKSDGNITFNALGSINVLATEDTNITGMQIAATAQAEIKVHGNASAELSASGQVVVQAAMVMIN